jgi:hypothetical protein
MEPETPRRLPHRVPDDRAILGNDFRIRGAGEEIKVQDTTNQPVLDQ